MNEEILKFANRSEFRKWLYENKNADEGYWLLFRKKGEPKIITAAEALEEALCFGWIDGQMKSIGDIEYLKYFSKRRKKSKWSEKNKGLVGELRKQGLMTEFGEEAVNIAKQNGMWDMPKPAPVSQTQINEFKETIKPYAKAYENFFKMSPSEQKKYTGFYFDAKTDNGKSRRLEKIITMLNEGKKLMEK